METHRRRVALQLGDIERGLAAADSSSTATPYRDEGVPVPKGFLDPTLGNKSSGFYSSTMEGIMATQRPGLNHGPNSPLSSHRRRASNTHGSDSGLGSSIMSVSEKFAMESPATSMTEEEHAKQFMAASAITRSAAAHASSMGGLPRLSERAINRIQEHILAPLLATPSLKDFHPLVRDCPRRIHQKEIVCLRDLEKTLLLMAPVSDKDPRADVVGRVTHCGRCLKDRAKTAKLYQNFCLTSIYCIQATVEFLNEREQTRPHDRPYTNGYFVDLVDQIKRYAQQVQATRAKEEAGEDLDEMDAEKYVSPAPYICRLVCCYFGHHLSSSGHGVFPHESLWPEAYTAAYRLYKKLELTNTLHRSDEIRLYGGPTRNGRPAELVRVKKNGKAISIATGEPIANVDDDTQGGMKIKRSLSEDEDDESAVRSMARRKRSASAAELAPRQCSAPGCDKQFKRPCDLTKHEKTHTRPWKCPHTDCKYHEQGWPTEKELGRHINDKHSSAPKFYPCLYTPCAYKSKRESNCKQHMEKTHGWVYVRSKNNGKKGAPSSIAPATPHMDSPSTTDSYGIATPENNDFEMRNAYDNSPVNDYHNDSVPLGPTFRMDISPVESHPSHPQWSSSGTFPDLFEATNAFSVNDGQDMANYAPYPEDLFPGDDLYSAPAQLPTPSNGIFQREQPSFAHPAIPTNADPIPHISPAGQGNAMLYTPSSMDHVDDFNDYNSSHGGNDFTLFPSMATSVGHPSANSNTLFGEISNSVPSDAVNFGPNTQHLEDFYAMNSSTGPMWTSDDEATYGNYGDHS